MPELAPSDLVRHLQAVGEGDRDSFRVLWEHFAPRLKGYLLKRGCSDDQAEELVQETMMRVWRNAARFEPSKAGVSTWIYTIARNCLIDRVRQGKRPELDPEDPALVPDGPTAPDEQVQASADAARLRNAIAELPQEQAAVVHASYFRGQSLGAIATETQLPLGTVKTRARLAMKRLRELLQGMEWEAES